MEVRVDLKKLQWSTEMLSLEKICERYPGNLPDYLYVAEGYHCSDDDYCDRGDIYKVHGLKEEFMYNALAIFKSIDYEESAVLPLSYPRKVKMVPPLSGVNKVYHGLMEVCQDYPRYFKVLKKPVCNQVTELFLNEGDTLEMLEAIIYKGSDKPSSLLVETVPSRKGGAKNKFKLPVDKSGLYEYVQDHNLYSLADIEMLQEKFPGHKRVRFVEEEEEEESEEEEEEEEEEISEEENVTDDDKEEKKRRKKQEKHLYDDTINGVHNIYKGEFVLKNTICRREMVTSNVTGLGVDYICVDGSDTNEMPNRQERLQLIVVDSSIMDAEFYTYHLPRENRNVRKIDVSTLQSSIYFKIAGISEHKQAHDYDYVKFSFEHQGKDDGDYEDVSNCHVPPKVDRSTKKKSPVGKKTSKKPCPPPTRQEPQPKDQMGDLMQDLKKKIGDNPSQNDAIADLETSIAPYSGEEDLDRHDYEQVADQPPVLPRKPMKQNENPKKEKAIETPKRASYKRQKC